VEVHWVLAFGLAACVGLLGVPLLRFLALDVGLVDAPGPTKVHAREIPYLGGVAIAGATIAGLLLEPRLGSRIAVVALAAIGVALVGLVDDHRTLGPWFRLAVEAGAAGAVMIAGVRAEPFGVPALDVAVTLVWIVGITNALNLFDNMDGLAAGTAGVIAAGVFALAAIGGQEVVATVGAALAGACAGFLVHNWRPASIFMGDAGSLFLGFVVSIAVLELRPDISLPWSLAVPLLLLALPVLDTSMVTVARIRHGRRVITGGKDHLSHRLVALGMSPPVAVATLIGVEGVLTTFAVACGSGAVPLWVGAAVAAAVLAGLVAATARAHVYAEPAMGFRTSLRRKLRKVAPDEVDLRTAALAAADHDGPDQ
jgi:UDP-GlcNAc:undecaprenyl-phosphate/decaprenyl-phosphate GlcNAc-1-phosphate transferase